MDDYKLANIFDISKHIQRINNPFRSAITIYAKARNNTRKRNINAISPPKNNGFQRGIYNIHLGLYHIYPTYGIMEKCFRDQENMY